MKKTNKKIIRIGSYSIGLTALAIAIIIVANLFIGQLPANIIKFDMTSDALLTFGDETKKLVSGIKDEITLYHIVTEGYENAYVTELLERYDAESDKIKVEKIDPVKKPTFTTQFTEDKVTDNSVIVVSEKRNTIVSGDEFFMYEPTGYEGTLLTYSEYQYYYQMCAQSGYTLTATEYFYGEKEVSGAIDFVMSETLPVVYALTGHGELEFGSAFGELTETENVEMKDLTLIAGETIAVPEDAKAVFINAPQKDITKEEYDALVKYLDASGYVILTTIPDYYSKETTPNLCALTEYMGLTATTDIIMENSADHYYTVPYYLLPEMEKSGILSEIAGANYSVISMYSYPITTLDVENRSFAPLLSTSDKAYLYDENMTEDTEIDENSYTIAYQAQISDSATGETKGTFIWFSSYSFFEDSVAGFGNALVYSTILQKTCGKTASINVAAKAITNATLDINAVSTMVGYTCYVVIIPLAFLIAGFVIWFTRRRK